MGPLKAHLDPVQMGDEGPSLPGLSSRADEQGPTTRVLSEQQLHGAGRETPPRSRGGPDVGVCPRGPGARHMPCKQQKFLCPENERHGDKFPLVQPARSGQRGQQPGEPAPERAARPAMPEGPSSPSDGRTAPARSAAARTEHELPARRGGRGVPKLHPHRALLQLISVSLAGGPGGHAVSPARRRNGLSCFPGVRVSRRGPGPGAPKVPSGPRGVGRALGSAEGGGVEAPGQRRGTPGPPGPSRRGLGCRPRVGHPANSEGAPGDAGSVGKWADGSQRGDLGWSSAGLRAQGRAQRAPGTPDGPLDPGRGPRAWWSLGQRGARGPLCSAWSPQAPGQEDRWTRHLVCRRGRAWADTPRGAAR